jgi:hypothetical protein
MTNNEPFHFLTADLRGSDPLCRYVTVERGYLDLLLAQSAEKTAQLAIACELLQRTRAELLRAWDENRLQPYQRTALQSINECLNNSRLPVRVYRHSARREFASILRTLLTRTQSVLQEDAKREREHKRNQIAQVIEQMGEGLSIVLESTIASCRKCSSTKKSLLPSSKIREPTAPDFLIFKHH